MAEPRTTITVRVETLELMEKWKARVEKQMGLAEQSWDQFLTLFANSKVVP